MSDWSVKIIPFNGMSSTDWFEPFFLRYGYVPSKGDFIVIKGKKFTIVSITLDVEKDLIEAKADSGLRRMS